MGLDILLINLHSLQHFFILDQLMNLHHANSLPPNPTDSSSPLKKILMWNGLSSWGSVRPGRGEFLKQKCPVSTCALVTDKTQAEDADLVLFKDLFSRGSQPAMDDLHARMSIAHSSFSPERSF